MMMSDNDPKTRPSDSPPPDDAEREKTTAPRAEFFRSLRPEAQARIREDAARAEGLKKLHLPLTPKDHCDRAMGLYYKRRFKEALNIYERVVRKDPQQADAWLGKTYTLAALKRYEQALKALERVIRIVPTVAGLWDTKGALLTELGRLEEAVAAYDRAIELDPNCADAWADKGRVLTALDRIEEALNAFAGAIRSNPANADAWICKGILLCCLKRVDDGRECFRRATDVRPDSDDAWYHVARSSAIKGDRAACLRALSKAIALAPKWRERARTQVDFDPLREDEDFKKLMGEAEKQGATAASGDGKQEPLTE